MRSNPPVTIEYTLEFKRNLKKLSKKYRHIRSDVEPVIKRLQSGEKAGIRFRAWVMRFSKSESA